MPKEIVGLAALIFSWTLVLMPVTAVLGYWSATGWIGLMCLMTTPVIMLGFVQAQVERRQDPVRRRAHFRAHSY